MSIVGAEVREVPLASGNQGWRLDLDAVFAACDERTRAIYYASPGNPTGWILERDEAERLLAFCRERNIAILADEVYHRLVYDRPVAPSILEIATAGGPRLLAEQLLQGLGDDRLAARLGDLSRRARRTSSRS